MQNWLLKLLMNQKCVLLSKLQKIYSFKTLHFLVFKIQYLNSLYMCQCQYTQNTGVLRLMPRSKIKNKNLQRHQLSSSESKAFLLLKDSNICKDRSDRAWFPPWVVLSLGTLMELSGGVFV